MEGVWLHRLLLVLALLLIALPASAAEEVARIPARAWLVMDATTRRVLLAEGADEPLPIASTTKIMTAILALERGDLDEVVTAGAKPYETGGTTIYLEMGEQQRLEDLLYALMLESANDAGVAIAEHLAGSEEGFADWMNEKARALGATGTHFANSHGLHDPTHLSTARDLALIARYAMQNPTFRAIAGTEEWEMPGAPGQPPRHLTNRNQLVGYYAGATGVKNGFTEEALLTNVASAKRGDDEVIAVVLGMESRLWSTSMALLDFGFERLAVEPVAQPAVATRPPELPAAVTAPPPDEPPPAPVESAPAERPPAPAQGQTARSLLYLVLWLGGSYALTDGLNGWRTALAEAKEEPERGAA